VKRRSFLSSALASLGALPLLDEAQPTEISSEDVKEVLVMFKCHLDVGFVDTHAAITPLAEIDESPTPAIAIFRDLAHSDVA
jgi:hypothetical protein